MCGRIPSQTKQDNGKQGARPLVLRALVLALARSFSLDPNRALLATWKSFSWSLPASCNAVLNLSLSLVLFSPSFSPSQVADRLPRSWREKARLLLPPCMDNPKKDRLTLDGQMLSSTFLGKKSFMWRRLQSQELETLAVSSLI